MANYMLIFASALILAIGVTPLARRLALRTGIIDRPNARKVHQVPTPLLGGVAIYSAFVLTLIMFGDREYVLQGVGILVGASLVSFCGLWDDRGRLHPLLKLLLGQPLAVIILILLSRVQVTLLPHPALNVLLTIVWVMGITSAFNLLDNMDGLSAGVAAIAAWFFLLLAVMSRQYLVAPLAAALLGASLGFLRYNFNPAQIFMGDSGALFLGFILAAIGLKLRFPASSPVVSWMIPVLVLGLPILDTSLVTISRLRRGLNPISTPGKDHVSHRLVRLGLSQREAVMALYLVAAALGGLALFVTQVTTVEAGLVGGAVLLAGAWMVWKLEQVQVDRG